MRSVSATLTVINKSWPNCYLLKTEWNPYSYNVHLLVYFLSPETKQNWSIASFAWYPFLYLEWQSYSSTRLASQSPLSVKHPCSLTVPPCLVCSTPSAVGEPLLFFACFPELPLMLSHWIQQRGMSCCRLPCPGSGSALCAASMDFTADPKS